MIPHFKYLINNKKYANKGAVGIDEVALITHWLKYQPAFWKCPCALMVQEFDVIIVYSLFGIIKRSVFISKYASKLPRIFPS